jgi:hypothetical protein
MKCKALKQKKPLRHIEEALIKFLIKITAQQSSLCEALPFCLQRYSYE